MTFYDLNMNSKRINNTQDPSANQDVATKNYVDTLPSPALLFRSSLVNGTGFAVNTALIVITSSTLTITAGRTYEIMGRLCVQWSSANVSGKYLYVKIYTPPSSNIVQYILEEVVNTQATNHNETFEGSIYLTASEFGTGSRVVELIWLDTGNTGGLNPNPNNLIGTGSAPQQLIVKEYR